MINRLLTVLIAIAISGCGGDRTVHPLIETVDAQPANEFFGTYFYDDDEKHRFILHVDHAGSGFPKNFFRVIAIFGAGEPGLAYKHLRTLDSLLRLIAGKSHTSQYLRTTSRNEMDWSLGKNWKYPVTGLQ